ncbi:hypothetical protein CNBG_4843 [Cryptococcus deuterogattii R265]|uniref:uncharacterized protein n=1 Tax=Cryptococcus deuterogattii (strain R265) TaxID=294750 RepID=UPI001937C2C0|nr:hypothetical protein CNBG_4843 [Cryptococcus deuterogattii R265]
MFNVGLSTLIFLAGNVLQAITLLIVSIFIFAICRRADRILKAATIASRDLTQYPSIHPALIQIFITVGLFFVQLIMRIVEGAQGAYAYAATHVSLFRHLRISPYYGYNRFMGSPASLQIPSSRSSWM